MGSFPETYDDPIDFGSSYRESTELGILAKNNAKAPTPLHTLRRTAKIK